MLNILPGVRIYLFNNPKIYLIGCIALDNNKFDYPSLGGTRTLNYSSYDSAIEDAMHLAILMTKKCKLAEVPYYGGKCTLIKPKNIVDKKKYFESYGNIINELNGKFITGCDIGISNLDMLFSKNTTNYITGTTNDYDRDYLSYFTAFGVIMSIRITLKKYYNIKSLNGLKVVIQGVGKIGKNIAKILNEEEIDITLSDIDLKLAKSISQELNCNWVKPENVYNIKCDVFIPCALGNTINQDSVTKLRCKLICGGANNQIIDETIYDILDSKRILFIPDWLCSIGGTIYAAYSYKENSLNLITDIVSSTLKKRINQFLEFKQSNCISLKQAVTQFIDNILNIQDDKY